jgi:shikimate dehydrogenase
LRQPRISLSPAIHNAAFAACEMDAVYVPLQAEALDPFLEALPDPGLSGFSVTRPFKVEVAQRVDQIDDIAALSGSVNTIKVEDGRLLDSIFEGEGYK